MYCFRLLLLLLFRVIIGDIIKIRTSVYETLKLRSLLSSKCSNLSKSSNEIRNKLIDAQLC